eukprot:TRINITY_DN2737_c0_g3_i1.p1 TRINITY_DN2737_c0_g3~~TRINITY_DN2737_c0_g3_i1.p1  ORF type:complete len:561 (-),score=99.44 TRINITY_DN2737_c0_g3_i1:20-1702(-)
MFAYNWWYGNDSQKAPVSTEPKNYIEAGWEVLSVADSSANVPVAGSIENHERIEDYHPKIIPNSTVEPPDVAKTEIASPPSTSLQPAEPAAETPTLHLPPAPPPPAADPVIQPHQQQENTQKTPDQPSPTKVKAALQAVTDLVASVAATAHASASASMGSISPRRLSGGAKAIPTPAPAPATPTPTPTATLGADTYKLIASLSTAVLVLLFAVLYQHWSHVLGAASFLVRSSVSLVLLVLLPLFVFPRLPQSLNMIASFVASLVITSFAATSYWPLVTFACSCLVANFFNPSWDGTWANKKSSSVVVIGDEKAAQDGRAWLNVLAKTLIEHIAALKIRKFDIGGALPSFRTVEFLPHDAETEGFDLLVRYEYNTDSSTMIELEVPVPIPGYGETKVPVFVAGPKLSGRIRLMCQIKSCSYKQRVKDAPLEAPFQTNTENFLALAVAFEPIEEIHVSDVRVSVAPRFEWLQWFSFIKRQIVSLFNSLLSTDKVSVYLFDSSFSSVGTLTIDAPLNTALKDIPLGSMYNVQRVIDEKMLICTKCARKTLPDSALCCPCEKVS